MRSRWKNSSSLFSLCPTKSFPLQQPRKCDVSELVEGDEARGALLLPKALCVQQWELSGHHRLLLSSSSSRYQREAVPRWQTQGALNAALLPCPDNWGPCTGAYTNSWCLELWCLARSRLSASGGDWLVERGEEGAISRDWVQNREKTDWTGICWSWRWHNLFLFCREAGRKGSNFMLEMAGEWVFLCMCECVGGRRGRARF